MNQKTAQEFLNQLPNIKHELPYSPSLLHKLFQETRSDSMVSLEKISESIGKEQGLTAKVLARANSAYYGLQSQVSSIGRAVSILGMTEIRNLILTLGFKAMARNLPPGLLNLAIYWRHQYRVGKICRELSLMLGMDEPDDLFTAGLLHDIGKLIIALYRPEEWKEIQALADKDNLFDADAEEKFWGIDHGIVGALTLQSWFLPPVLIDPVNWHHNPELSPESKQEARILCLADALDHHINGSPKPLRHPVDKVAPALGLDAELLVPRIHRAVFLNQKTRHSPFSIQ